ncbi:MAG: nuclear transport factor 2 family protein [Candidatus Sulfotelmatobacter sp.]
MTSINDLPHNCYLYLTSFVKSLHRQGRQKQVEKAERQIIRLFEEGDRALVAADLDSLSHIFADDYIQYDESGNAFTKQDVLNNLKSGAIRYRSMVSTGRRIRLLNESAALVHGSEKDEVEQAGRRFTVRYIYMDVVVKRSGDWEIVASQLARPPELTATPAGESFGN